MVDRAIDRDYSLLRTPSEDTPLHLGHDTNEVVTATASPKIHNRAGHLSAHQLQAALFLGHDLVRNIRNSFQCQSSAHPLEFHSCQWGRSVSWRQKLYSGLGCSREHICPDEHVSCPLDRLARRVFPFLCRVRFGIAFDQLSVILVGDGIHQRSIRLAVRRNQLRKRANEPLDGKLPIRLSRPYRAYVFDDVEQGNHRKAAQLDALRPSGVHVLVERRTEVLDAALNSRQLHLS